MSIEDKHNIQGDLVVKKLFIDSLNEENIFIVLEI